MWKAVAKVLVASLIASLVVIAWWVASVEDPPGRPGHVSAMALVALLAITPITILPINMAAFAIVYAFVRGLGPGRWLVCVAAGGASGAVLGVLCAVFGLDAMIIAALLGGVSGGLVLGLLGAARPKRGLVTDLA